ncbi:hypothetical protein BASA62_000463, partial [Batrachochytrium salamandrivorans]
SAPGHLGTNPYQNLPTSPSTTTQSEQPPQSTATQSPQHSGQSKIRKGRDDAKIALDLLLENQKLIADYNSKHDVKTGPSPNSCYNLVFLREQIDHIPKEIEDLLAKWERIKADKDLSRDSLKTWRAEYKDRIRRREKQREIVKKILREHEQNQPIGAQVREFFNSYRRMPE